MTDAIITGIDRRLAEAGSNVQAIRLLEEIAEAAKRYATNQEQRVMASVAKLKVARHGGRVLIDMADKGQRATRRSNRGNQHTASVAVSTLPKMGISEGRAARWQAVAKLSEDDFAARIEAIEDEDADDSLAVQAMGGLKAQGIVEWYTPAKYVDAAREVMGGIDLDPASSVAANKTIRAERIFTQEDDGLAQEWGGRVWLNPPYGKGSGLFTTKLVEEYTTGRVTAAVLLLNAYGFDSDWFQPLWDHPICFTDHRIAFTSPQRESGGPANGNIFVYLGPDPERFRDTFARFGAVVREWRDED